VFFEWEGRTKFLLFLRLLCFLAMIEIERDTVIMSRIKKLKGELEDAAGRKTLHHKSRNAHFSSATAVYFPTNLHNMRYLEDEYSTKLILDPSHVLGSANTVLDLRYWSNLRDIIATTLRQTSHRFHQPITTFRV
jgi:hypothetical protein